jgi:hypothetical protein
VQAARYPNVASIVMHHALLKALGKHNLAMDKHQQQLLEAGELQRQELLPELSYDELTVRARAPGALAAVICAGKVFWSYCLHEPSSTLPVL